ncbi:hypothetical protein [Winogradskyella sp.]|uniref:hypothetical protein n=1 Tax=Winogradskyella sp. TaxID=1883156 RepID=UPI00260F2D46|nr:hypothetical protein [uncultured Winogradskyella sp.]
MKITRLILLAFSFLLLNTFDGTWIADLNCTSEDNSLEMNVQLRDIMVRVEKATIKLNGKEYNFGINDDGKLHEFEPKKGILNFYINNCSNKNLCLELNSIPESFKIVETKIKNLSVYEFDAKLFGLEGLDNKEKRAYVKLNCKLEYQQ